MIPSYIALVLSFTFTSADAPKDDDVKKERDKLQGTWTIVSCQNEGTPAPETKGEKIKIEGDKIILFGKEKTTFKLDPSKMPRQLDLVPGDPKEPSSPSIYELNGDDLKLAIGIGNLVEAKSGEPVKMQFVRPASFDDNKARVFVLKRGELKNNLAEVPKDEDIKKEWDKLQGTWTILSYIEDDRHPRLEMKGMKVKFDGDKFRIDDFPVALFKLNSAKKPREMDFESSTAEFNVPLIYELNGDDLKLGMAINFDFREIDPKTNKPGPVKKVRGKRPTAFDNEKIMVIVLKRGDLVVKSDEEKNKKLIVGKWKFHSGGPYTPIFFDTEFTADGKVKRLEKGKEYKEPVTYTIKGDVLIVVRAEKDKDGKLKDREYKITIARLTETEFKSQYFKFERIKDKP